MSRLGKCRLASMVAMAWLKQGIIANTEARESVNADS